MSVWSMPVISTEERNFLALGHFPPPSPLSLPNVDFTNNPIGQEEPPFYFCPAKSYPSPRKSKKKNTIKKNKTHTQRKLFKLASTFQIPGSDQTIALRDITL